MATYALISHKSVLTTAFGEIKAVLTTAPTAQQTISGMVQIVLLFNVQTDRTTTRQPFSVPVLKGSSGMAIHVFSVMVAEFGRLIVVIAH